MSSEYVFALDAGSGSGRCAVFDLHGNQVATASQNWSPRVPHDEPLGAEFDPHETWAVLCQTTRQMLGQKRVDASAVRGISVSSQRDGAVFLDGDGRELHCSTNRDARGVLHAEDIAAQFGETVYSVTGRWPLGLGLLSRLWWFRIHRPQVYERIAHVCMIDDWLTYRLCGELCSEPTAASSSLLFDIVERGWSTKLAECLGYSSTWYPPCHQPGDRVGFLTAEAAAALCLPEGIPVAVGAADSQAACLGCGAFDEGETTAVAGTTMPVQMLLSHPLFDDQHRLQLGAYVVPGRWVLESNAGFAGTALQWFCQAFVGTDTACYSTLEGEMSQVKPGEVLAVLGPQVADFGQLSFPPKSTFAFPFLGGMESPPTRGSFGRAILENLAYAIRGNVEQLGAVSGQKAESLNLCGGLARSGLFAQIVADVCGLPVYVPVVREASCAGTAICAAVGARVYPDLPSAAKNMVHMGPAIEPHELHARAYKGLYRKWVKLFEQARAL